jgi:RNA polymerase-binding transcription factor DksA
VNLENYRRRLAELERELQDRAWKEAETAQDVWEDQPDPGDLGRFDELREEYFALGQSDFVVLAQVRAALRRIDNRTFGHCVVDGEPIEEKRLDSVPWTPYCRKHQQELEERAGTRTPSL